jgi:hypothetical protein
MRKAAREILPPHPKARRERKDEVESMPGKRVRDESEA